MIIEKFNEKKLQKVIHKIISEPSLIRATVSGKRIQIVSPGRLNVHEGPDFLSIAILLEGTLIVGDAEFHKKSSDWFLHSHHNQDSYKSVILHIVMENDASDSFPFEILIIDNNEVKKNLLILDNESVKKPDILSIEELQDYALIRLLRKASEAQKLLNNLSLDNAFLILCKNYLERYFSRRKRPVYSPARLQYILNNITSSQSYHFLEDLASGTSMKISEKMFSLLKIKLADEGASLRREIILNCVLPIAICLADTESRISLFLWFWSTPSLVQYGMLRRRFPDIPQNFLWQQQGMLEYLKEYGGKGSLVADAIREYGFAEVLGFYKIGKSPLEDYKINNHI